MAGKSQGIVTKAAVAVGSGLFDVTTTILTAPIKVVGALKGDPALRWHGDAEGNLANHDKSEFATCLKCSRRITRNGYYCRDENVNPFLEKTEAAKICWTHPGKCQVIEDGTKSGAYKWTCCDAKTKDARGCTKGEHKLPSEQQGYSSVVLYDGSEFSNSALSRALQLRLKHESVAVVYLVQDHMDGEKKEEAAAQHQHQLQEAVKVLKGVIDGIDRKEIPDVDSFVFLTTKPKETAVKVAKDLGCTSIFVGSQSQAKEGFFQGSFSKYVAENAHCDTVVIKHRVSKNILE